MWFLQARCGLLFTIINHNHNHNHCCHMGSLLFPAIFRSFHKLTFIGVTKPKTRSGLAQPSTEIFACLSFIKITVPPVEVAMDNPINEQMTTLCIAVKLGCRGQILRLSRQNINGAMKQLNIFFKSTKVQHA